MSDKTLDTAQLVNGFAILLSFYVGYKYGISTLLGDSSSVASKKPKNSPAFAEGSIFSDHRSDYKMILVVRNDLKMGKGKIAAQCCHAAVGAYQKGIKTIPNAVRHWDSSGSAKIAVKVESDRELIEIRNAVKDHFNYCLIRDAGRTQVAPNSATVLAIGPAPAEQLDRFTGHLKLL